MPKPGERTCLDDDSTFVEYRSGCIVLEAEGSVYPVVRLDATAMTKFDAWRVELDKDIALRKAAGF